MKQLVSVDSTNPSLVPGARGEAEASELLCDWLRGQGIAAELQPAAPGRPNVVATIGPAQAREQQKPALLIVAHMDTVRALASRPPYSIDPLAPIAAAATAALLHVTGSAELAGMSAWTDTALLAQAGIPGVVFGPSGRGLHGAEEYVETSSLIACAEVLHSLILNQCR